MIRLKLIKEITGKTLDLEDVEDLQQRILGVYGTWNPSTPEGKKYKDDIGRILDSDSLKEGTEEL